jgi:hypothetical protein
VSVAFQFVVEIRVRVEMDDRQSRHVLAEGTQDRQRDGVVAAQRNHAQAFVEQFSDFIFDRREGLMKCEFQIARIAVGAFGTEVDTCFRQEFDDRNGKRRG